MYKEGGVITSLCLDYSEPPSPPPNPEEMPVGGAGKSFTQLLNEKVRADIFSRKKVSQIICFYLYNYYLSL